MSVKRNFELRLPEPVGPFRTLADVRIAISAVHDQRPEMRPQWEHLGELALAASEGGSMDDLMIALRVMRMHRVF